MHNYNPNYAIQFGEGVDKGMETQKVFPFFYPFVNSENDRWDALKGAGTLGNLSDIGPVVAANGGKVRLAMKLEPDYMWKLLSLNYTTYYLNEREALALTVTDVSIAANSDQLVGVGTLFLTELIPGDTVQIGAQTFRIESITNNSLAVIKDADIPTVAVAAVAANRLVWNKYEWYEAPVGFFLEQNNQTAIGTPLLRYIEASVWLATPQNVYIYGGMNLDRAINNHADVIPVPVKSLQGYEYGYGQLYTDFLLPREGIVFFDIINKHPTKKLVVGCTARGLKIRV